MNEQKTTVLYDKHNPTADYVKHVAIQTETQPLYVWATYGQRAPEDLPRLGTDMLVIPVEQARRLFDFKAGSVADVVSIPTKKVTKKDIIWAENRFSK